MGRWVTGDWDWKFAFADQTSSFGEVLDNICNYEENKGNYFDRYIGTEGQGEKIEGYIEDVKSFVKCCKKFIGKNFRVRDEEKEGWCDCKVKWGNEYWDKLMIWKMLKDFNNFKDYEGEFLNFEVKY